MSGNAGKRAAVVLAAAVVVTGLAGCQGGDTKATGSASASPAPGTQSREEAAKAVRAASGEAARAGSAKVGMRVVVSGGQAAGSSTFTGVQGWGPSVADLKVTDSTYLAAVPGAPAETRVLTAGGAAYLDVGAAQTARTGGKRWMKVDLAGAGAGAGLVTQLTAGLGSVDQDPARELGLLAGSPTLKHLGPVRGSGAQAYGGELPGGRYVEVRIGADGRPARMDVRTEAGGALTELTTTYSDYGVRADVRPPAAGDTIGFTELLKRFTGRIGQG
ncbi:MULTISPECIES: hypothetical protein [unclassified Streptomyces]|uniref:hypothetical protein n=1 Tax=unclassified Streptomyces TaxID=2593676 RepID=UPI0006B045E2|nr:MULTISPECIES: hypothetical protein [unclassified Streptomyces]KOX22891.1 hypothetical protein ADL06_23595 [Streptomyces sp. NRRL F-6491]KOX40112.1 hypothetical protein ADL08_23750 [Streptomyces sp. NRRL F-6492]